jgi:hypothetical protein
VLASAAAGSALENSDDVHRFDGLAFPFLGTFLFLSFLSSGRYPPPGDSFCFGPYGPNEAQQFASNCSGDLSLVLSSCSHSHVTLAQPVLHNVQLNPESGPAFKVVHASNLELDHVTRRKPLQGVPAVRLEDTPGAILRDSRAFPGTEIFLSTN